MTKECVRSFLLKNDDFLKIFDEDSGINDVTYTFEDVYVKFFYMIDHVEIWLLNTPEMYRVIEDIKEFACLAHEICEDQIRSNKH